MERCVFIFALQIKKGGIMLNWNDVIKYANHGNPDPDRTVVKSTEQWMTQLTPEEYRVTRGKGTEARFTGAHCSSYDPGSYSCICCNTQLFDSESKFNSGTGWPSFTLPVQKNAVKYHKDGSHGMIRIEALCNVCDAHLGHVFPDGPKSSGMRYCINSISLKKEENEK